MFTAYLDKNAFDDIIFFEDEKYPKIKRILCKNIPIVLNLTESELQIELDDIESPLSLLMLESASIQKPHALKSFFSELKDDPKLYEHKPDALFVLDITVGESKQLRQNYGVLIFSKHEINDNWLSGGLSKELVKTETFLDGWKGFFKHPFHKGNALIISDNYLFQNEISTFNKGIENIKQLIDGYLPAHLSIPFQITIIANNTPKNSNKPPKTVEWWTNHFGALKAKIKTLRPYDIEIELILTETVHKRILISNYIFSWTDKGYDIFHHLKKEEINDDNTINIHHLFNNIHDYEDNYSEMVNVLIGQLKMICKNAGEYVKNTKKQHIDKMVLGDCDLNKKTRNRLLN